MIEGLIVIALIVGVMIFMIVKGASNSMELVKYGVDIKGTVTNKKTIAGGYHTTPRDYLTYQYTVNGQVYSHTSDVGPDVLKRFNVGDAFDVTYSSRKPSVSDYTERVDRMRKVKG
jgi:hypothetical protein